MKKHLSTCFFLLATCLPAFAQNTFPVRFAHGTEFFPANFDNARQAPNVGADELANGLYARYIQLEKIMNSEERTAFEATGVRVIGYVQFGAYLVLLPQGFDFQKIKAYAPRSVLPVKPEWKMARSLREQPYGAWAVRGDYIDINLQIYPSLRIAEGAALCRQHGLEVLKEGTQNGFLQLRIHQDRVGEVAALPFVQYLELVSPPSEREDTKGRSLHRANMVDSDAPMGKKYNGDGVTTLVRDDGPVGPHVDFRGRLDNLATQPAGFDVHHADWVAGCIGAAGNIDPTAKGMASGAFVYVTAYQSSFQDPITSSLQDKGITIANTSYSDGCNVGYTLSSQTVDKQLFENPILTHVFSAGNSNETDCGYGAGNQWGNITGGHKMAKNALMVANVSSDGTIHNRSSRGPAYDGRLKPDISAFGVDAYMTQPDNTYSLNTGTSFSAPNVAGCLAQLTQAFKTIEGVDNAPATLLKATVLNTATDLGNVGPDFKFGWGNLNAWRALRLLEQNHWLEGSTDQNGNVAHALQIPPGVREAKIMLVWAEPASAENAAKALLNDLDLRVDANAGPVYLPWILDPTPAPIVLDSPAGKGRDSLNNVEQVLIVNPSAGPYTIYVKGTEVPLGPQHYYIAWDFVFDEIKVTYPNGGEGFVPGEVERIHWDAHGNTGTFALRYSTDGGNSFQPMAAVGGDRRMYDWTVPNTVSGKVYVEVQRGTTRDTSDFSASIVGVPKNILVTKVCPDSMWVGWDEVLDTLSYEVYLLGNKYMEVVGASNTNSLAFPIQSAGDEQWVSVRSTHADGTAGRRAIAVSWPGELFHCTQQFDLAVREMLSPLGDVVVSCSPSEVTVAIRVRNEGLDAATVGATAFYQANNNPPVSEALPGIAAGGSLDFTFQTPLTLDFNGPVTLKSWVVFPGDMVDFNDTISRSFSVGVVPTNQFFVENFETVPGFPAGWTSANPDDDHSWAMSDNLSLPVVGPDGLAGRSIYFDFFSYGPNQEDEEDFLFMIPLDLTGLNNPALTFDLAHSQYNASYADSLRVEKFPSRSAGCGTSSLDRFWPMRYRPPS